MSNLGDFYKKEVVKKLMDEFKLENIYACPKIEKVVINCGLGEATDNPGVLEKASTILGKITGQKPVTTFAKRSISAFKLKKGAAIGLKMTLRGKRMYDFLEKFFRITLPRLRDFRGLPTTSFDRDGNYTVGLKELTVFPETATIAAEKSKGLEITIVTNSHDLAKSKRLLELLGMLFQRN